MPSSTPDHVILDLEGIAFDPLPSSTHAVRRALVRVGQPWPLGDDLDWIARVPVHEALRRLVDGDEAAQRRFLAHVRHYYCRQRWDAVR
jgi:phosphoglycolate phosphatase-like HAD superfamily hydrolase